MRLRGHSVTVSTLPFHGGNPGSIPGGPIVVAVKRFIVHRDVNGGHALICSSRVLSIGV
jgi:hypothetical protein